MYEVVYDLRPRRIPNNRGFLCGQMGNGVGYVCHK